LYKVENRNIKKLEFEFPICFATFTKDNDLIAVINTGPNVPSFKLACVSLLPSPKYVLISSEILFEWILDTNEICDIKCIWVDDQNLEVMFLMSCSVHSVPHKLKKLTYSKLNASSPYKLVKVTNRYLNLPILGIMTNKTHFFVLTVSKPLNQMKLDNLPCISSYHIPLYLQGYCIMSRTKHLFQICPATFQVVFELQTPTRACYVWKARSDPRLSFSYYTNDICLTDHIMLIRSDFCQNFCCPEHAFDRVTYIRVQSLHVPALKRHYKFPVLNHVFSFFGKTFIFSSGFGVYTFGTEPTEFGECEHGCIDG
jgi:hypothetical protein